MAYIPANLSLRGQDIGNQGTAEWTLRGTDAVTAVRVVGYISDAKAKGMKVGDTVRYIKTDATPITAQEMILSAINATTGAGDLSDGLAITATNTD